MAVEYEGADPKDPAANPLVHFGIEVREERLRQGLSLAGLAKQVPCDKSLVQKIEKAERVPSREFAEACDRAFDSNGRFLRHWRWAIKYAFPNWFRRYVELEEQATHIRIFEPQLVPGLLQTEDYARSILELGRWETLEDLVTARMERQRILNRQDSPRLWVIVDAGALTRTVGGSQVMHDQLVRLRQLATDPRHVVQVVPYRQTYHGWSSAFNVLSFDEGADVVHVDSYPRGHLLAEPDDVAEAVKGYDLLKATALPPDEAVALIDSVIKEHYP